MSITFENSEIFKTFPTFDKKADLPLYEDFISQGFQFCEQEVLDSYHVKIGLRTLAKTHAASFVYEETKSKETGKQYRLNQKYDLEETIVDLTEPTLDMVLSVLDDKSDENLAQVAKNLEERQSSTKYRRTLSHGNLTLRNLMFKYQEKTPIECKLINFKTKLYVPPICDVLQLIFCNTSKDVLQKEFHVFLDHYYKHLNKELCKYSLKIKEILSPDEWQHSEHHFLPLIKLQCNLTEELKEDLNCPLLSRQDCCIILQNKLKSNSYQLISFKVSPLDSVSGFLGAYQNLEINVNHQGPETINCFVKCMPKATASKEVVQDSNGFAKEAFVFNTLIPKYQQFGIDTMTNCVPECYFQRADDVVVFEDLTVLHYKPTPAINPYDFNTLSMIVKKLAKSHAGSFIYEEKMSEKLGYKYRLNDEFGEFFEEAIILADENHSGGKLMQCGVRSVLHATDLFPELKSGNNWENLQKHWPEFEKLFYSTITASDRFRNVVTHGDLWSSNILLKFADGKATDCRFVDYQLLRYCPPGHDLLALLHLTTIRENRLKFGDQIECIYYDELANILESYGYDITTVLPYEDFIGGVEHMRAGMVMQAAIYAMFSMCTPEQISTWITDEEECKRVFFEDRREFLARMCRISPIYRSRLRDRIRDVYDYCNTMETN